MRLTKQYTETRPREVSMRRAVKLQKCLRRAPAADSLDAVPTPQFPLKNKALPQPFHDSPGISAADVFFLLLMAHLTRVFRPFSCVSALIAFFPRCARPPSKRQWALRWPERTPRNPRPLREHKQLPTPGDRRRTGLGMPCPSWGAI